MSNNDNLENFDRPVESTQQTPSVEIDSAANELLSRTPEASEQAQDQFATNEDLFSDRFAGTSIWKGDNNAMVAADYFGAGGGGNFSVAQQGIAGNFKSLA